MEQKMQLQANREKMVWRKIEQVGFRPFELTRLSVFSTRFESHSSMNGNKVKILECNIIWIGINSSKCIKYTHYKWDGTVKILCQNNLYVCSKASFMCQLCRVIEGNMGVQKIIRIVGMNSLEFFRRTFLAQMCKSSATNNCAIVIYNLRKLYIIFSIQQLIT